MKNTKTIPIKKDLKTTNKADKKGVATSSKSSKTIPVKLESSVIVENKGTNATEKKTSEYMSVYEYTALVRFRALQLGFPGVYPNIEIDPSKPEDFDPINIATKETRLCLTTLIIRRTLTDGSTEDWDPKEMIFPKI